MTQIATQADPESIPASIFRAYDIRGVAEQQLTSQNVKRIGQAIGSEALDQNITSLLVGYDGRLSSPALSIALIEGIRTRIENDQLRTGSGKFSELEVDRSYIDDICTRIQLSKPLKVVIDCGNAVPGKIAPTLFKELGCDVHPIFCEIDGNFPNHHPDPTVPENLAALASTVLEKNADIGIALDGDGDRVGLITNRGKFVDADRMLMALVQSILPNYPGRTVVFDVKCTSKLGALVKQFGGSPIMHRSGHSLMKQKMRETNAILGGEFAAHIFIKDNWFGFDDGLYVAARLLKIISESCASSDEIFEQFFTGFCTPEIRIEVPEERKFLLMDRLIELASFPTATLITLDGLRVEYADGWGLVRASNTSPALQLRFEADTRIRMNEIQEQFKHLILSADKTLEISF
jgi:phosphomannomutase/phosphoglucomutase